MERRVFVDADGELLIIPQSGALRIVTELGRIDVAPGSIALVPRGMKFRVDSRRRSARLCRGELRAPASPARARPDRRQRPRQSARFRNAGRGLRGPRRADRGHPEIASARCGRRRSTIRRSMSSPGTAITRRGATTSTRFNAIGTVSFDHPDPSIFTVLTSRATCRAEPMPTSSFSRRAGWSPRTRSGRPGSTAT